MPESYELLDAGQTSKFNAGILQMNRIHQLQDKMNCCRLNPLVHDVEVGSYNYEIWISCVSGLLEEVWAKLSSKEKKDIEGLRNDLTNFINKYPVNLERKNILNNKRFIKFDENVWRVTLKWIIEYETKIRELLDKRGMNSPAQDESDLF